MVPGSSDPRWTRALSSDSDVVSATLATKILLTRLRRELRASPNEMSDKVNELRAYFETNTFAQKDMSLL